MKNSKQNFRKASRIIFILLACFVLVGCGEPGGFGKGKAKLLPEIDTSTTIGSLVEVFSLDVIGVEGYALVGGLNGTGSSQCPAQIRAYLEKYIMRQLPEEKNVDKFFSSRDTAVVVVRGFMPAAVSKNQRFDVKVTALAMTQTTSLEAGELLGVELKEAGRFGAGLKVLATAEGPVYIDKLAGQMYGKKSGYEKRNNCK